MGKQAEMGDLTLERNVLWEYAVLSSLTPGEFLGCFSCFFFFLCFGLVLSFHLHSCDAAGNPGHISALQNPFQTSCCLSGKA